jgi:hypothetical protein
MSLSSRRLCAFDKSMPMSIDAIVDRFRTKLSSDDLEELQQALHRYEEEQTARTGAPRMATDPSEPASEAQRKAMHAAASGKSTLGIPQAVGKELTGEWGEGHDAPSPPAFVGKPVTHPGGAMLDQNLKPYHPKNARRGQRFGSAMASDAALALKYAGQIRCL